MNFRSKNENLYLTCVLIYCHSVTCDVNLKRCQVKKVAENKIRRSTLNLNFSEKNLKFELNV